jgi:hypothetical protein
LSQAKKIRNKGIGQGNHFEMYGQVIIEPKAMQQAEQR